MVSRYILLYYEEKGTIMRMFLAATLALALLMSGIGQPRAANAASSGDVVLVLALMGGAAYGTYLFTNNYEIVRKSSLYKEGDKYLKVLEREYLLGMNDSMLISNNSRLTLNVLNLKF